MNLNFIGTFTILLFLVVLGLLIYFFTKVFHDRKEPKNKDLLINYLSNYTEGYAIGVIKDIKRSNDKVKILFSPRDIDEIEVRDKHLKIEDQYLFTRRHLLFPLDLSPHRKIWMALPPKPEQLPNEIKLSDAYPLYKTMIDKANNNKEAEELMDLRINAQSKMLEKHADYSLVDEHFEMKQKFLEEQKDMTSPPKKKDE